MKFALAHHWLTSYRGGERVLEQMGSLFPDSDVYTLIQNHRAVIPGLVSRKIHTTRLQRIPRVEKLYRHLLPVHPLAIRTLRVDDSVDVLLSSDSSMIKGIHAPGVSHHICYCHSPPRYLWEMADSYKQASLAARIALDRCAPRLRRFDYESAQRVTDFIANSNFVADRIRKYYDRESSVIYPPVAVNEFRSDQKREAFALVISELVPYKRIDIAIEAFNKLGTKLVVIGDGPERKRLESIAKSNIQFMGRQPFSTLKAKYETASVFVFPGVEDFGITPVEAQAAGCPVIAFRAGGALETVFEGRTGAFFDEQTAECLADTISGADVCQFEASVCAESAQSFSAEKFRERYFAHVSRVLGAADSIDSRGAHPAAA